MANTAGLSAAQQELWAKQALIEAMEENFFKPFMSQKANSPITVKADFTKDKGYKMTIKFVAKLSGEGVDGDGEMEGNEEEMNQYSDTVEIDQKRNAVKLKGRMDEQKQATSLRSEARSVLGIWMAEIIEKEFFRKLGGIASYTFSNTPSTPSTNRVVYGGDAAADSDIDSADKMTLGLIFKLSAKVAEMTPKLKPIRYKGKNWFVLIIHPRQRYDLLQDSDYITLMKDAERQGKENPLISGADAVVDNIIIHYHNYVPTFSDWGGASEPGARALLLGAQAAALALGQSAGWTEKSFDYGNKWGICTGRILGIQKLVFDSEDFGVVAVDTYATSI